VPELICFEQSTYSSDYNGTKIGLAPTVEQIELEMSQADELDDDYLPM